MEIKGATSYRYDKSFPFSRLRPGTPFVHLLLVARRQDPADWTDVHELDKYFWLGHVSPDMTRFSRVQIPRFRARLVGLEIQAVQAVLVWGSSSSETSDVATSGIV